MFVLLVMGKWLFCLSLPESLPVRTAMLLRLKAKMIRNRSQCRKGLLGEQIKNASPLNKVTCAFRRWDTRTRTKNDRTRICSVTITPYPKAICLKTQAGLGFHVQNYDVFFVFPNFSAKNRRLYHFFSRFHTGLTTNRPSNRRQLLLRLLVSLSSGFRPLVTECM